MASSRKKKPHGGVGNLNAAKSCLPVIRRLQQGKPLPPNLARIAAISDLEAQPLIADKGGLENMTGGEQAMLRIWKTAREITLLIFHEMIQRGAIMVKDGDWDLQPGAQRLAKFLSEERAALRELGLERRSRNVMDLKDYVRENYGTTD